MGNYVKKIIFNIVFSLFVCSGAVIFGKQEITQENSDEEIVVPTESLQRLVTVIDNIKKYYYRSIDVSDLFDGAIKGMIFGLDPHSEYLDQDGIQELAMRTSGRYTGVGVDMISDKGVIKVITPIDDTPAYRAGIKSGDYIVQIGDKLVRDITPSEALAMMRGPRGSKLSLTVIRENESKPRIINLRRELIKLQSVKDAQLLEPGYGYIRVVVFQDSTEKEMVRKIKQLQKLSKGSLKGLILDLRNNPGGLFDSAVQVANDFLDATKLKNNKLIVSTKGQDKKEQVTAKASDGELLPNVPLVVLINEGSASAAEIVAGALQDHKRAIIVGMRSFGKGSVQTILPVGKNNAIVLTTALYYTPLGRLIQARGIEPDINIEDMQILNSKEAQSLSRADESALVDHIQNTSGIDNNENKKISEQQNKPQLELGLARKDYQLYEALHILKSQNIMLYKP